MKEQGSANCDQNTCQTPKLNHGLFEPETVEENNFAMIVCDEGYSNKIPYRKCVNNQLIPPDYQNSFHCFKGRIYYYYKKMYNKA